MEQPKDKNNPKRKIKSNNLTFEDSGEDLSEGMELGCLVIPVHQENKLTRTNSHHFLTFDIKLGLL